LEGFPEAFQFRKDSGKIAGSLFGVVVCPESQKLREASEGPSKGSCPSGRVQSK